MYLILIFREYVRITAKDDALNDRKLPSPGFSEFEVKKLKEEGINAVTSSWDGLWNKALDRQILSQWRSNGSDVSAWDLSCFPTSIPIPSIQERFKFLMDTLVRSCHKSSGNALAK